MDMNSLVAWGERASGARPEVGPVAAWRPPPVLGRRFLRTPARLPRLRLLLQTGTRHGFSLPRSASLHPMRVRPPVRTPSCRHPPAARPRTGTAPACVDGRGGAGGGRACPAWLDASFLMVWPAAQAARLWGPPPSRRLPLLWGRPTPRWDGPSLPCPLQAQGMDMPNHPRGPRRSSQGSGALGGDGCAAGDGGK